MVAPSEVLVRAIISSVSLLMVTAVSVTKYPDGLKYPPGRVMYSTYAFAVGYSVDSVVVRGRDITMYCAEKYRTVVVPSELTVVNVT